MTTNNNNGSFVPAIIYDNADTDKLRIFIDNKNRAGVYQWIHKETGKTYIGSSVDLTKRLRLYYSITYLLNKKKGKSYIYSAILEHGFSSFKLQIIEYINTTGLSKIEINNLLLGREQFFIDLIKPEYNILKFAGNRLGSKHSEDTIKKN
jgi:group I intron endonuclease